ncbi:poly(ethylene terephthalate) hydrolase family protein [Aquimarina sp. 2304DJ70-9]|uniref:poly(ethylene terephthalate) hydrolase family protein n=1 Tax=Aquimarina penaris TaxID=3231044 RepID=UPI00346273FB
MKTVLLSILSIFFLVCSGIAQDYDVSSSSKTFRDADRRNRRVNARIYYPKVNRTSQAQAVQESFPVVVLGHGFVMGSSAYQNFYDTLVPRGYIVVFVNTEGSFFANHEAFSRDLAFMVEAIQNENNNSNSVLFGLVDDKSALIGHSMGGGAAVVAASLTDVETLVTFAPALLRFDTLTPATNVTAESIVFSGSSDGVTPPEENHIPIYDNLGSDCKYFINIEGGAHCYYANSNFFCDFGENSASSGIQISRTQQQAITFQFLNPWLDYKLKGDVAAQQQFVSDITNSDDITFENNCGNAWVQETTEINLTVFPNPANKTLSVKTSNNQKVHKVELYSQFGKLISTSSTSQVDVSGVKRGHYLIKIYVDGTIVTKKVVIKK